MIIDEGRLKRQKECINKWIKAGCIGGIQATTGVGKTFMAILAINYIISKRPEAIILVVVPSLYLQDQWITKLKEFGLSKYNIEVLVLNTAAETIKKVNFLIIDESHESVAPQRIKLYSNITYDILLWITATLKRSDDRHKLLLEIAPMVDEITLQEALENHYISDYKIYNIPVDLTAEEQLQYKSIQKSYTYYEYLLGGNFQAWIQSNYYLSKEYKEDDSQIKAINVKNALMFKTFVNKRKTILYNAFNKIQLTKSIIELFPDRKGIVFCESIKFATTLDDSLGKKSSIYHSGLKLQEKKLAISKFVDNRTSVNILTSVKALDRGVDISGVNLGICVAGSSKQLQDIQRRGRSGRINKDNTIAYYFNLYIPNTQEEKWVKTKCYNIPEVYWLNSLEEIKDKI